ncbi:MAG: TolC family protein [Desulfobacteraceae bacterium]|nr:MAG: TolC family protein [Desulfobacteraceae bacterium]
MGQKGAIQWVGIFLFFSLISLPATAAAQGSRNYFTLEKAISQALENSYKIKARNERIEQANDIMKQARADFLPKLGTAYSYNRLSEPPISRTSTLFGTQIPLVVGTEDNFRWTWFLRQPLFTGFALVSSYRLAELGINQSQLESDLEKLDLVLRVKETYFNILGADKAVEVAETTVESLSQTVKVARSFFEVGMIPINDVLKAEVELANAEQSLVRGKNLAQTARSTFNTILVRPVNAPVEVEDILVYKPEAGAFADFEKKALENRPEIKILDVNIQQTDQQIRLAKSKYYPEISFTYQYISEGDEASVKGSQYVDANHWEALVVANWTFWEWGKTYFAGREKESLKRQLTETKADVEDGIRLQVKQAMLDLDSSAKNIPTTQKGVDAGDENLRVNAERYKAQVSTITDLLDAQTLLARARLDYYRALYDHNQAKARLERALGNY